LDALWTLDILIAHDQVSYDGTLPPSDLKSVAEAVDRFAKLTDWPRKSIVTIKPPNAISKLSMLANSAEGLFAYLDVQATGIDKAFDDRTSTDFFARLAGGTPLARAILGDPEVHQQGVLSIADDDFRGSKCVAGLIATGPDAIERALELAKRYPPGLAMSMLINRFRFDYLRSLARSVGDVYIPGDSWREFSHRNAALSFQSLSRHMDAEYLMGIRQALESEENAAPGVLPPLGLYCLMKADPTGGPRAVIDVARTVTQQYQMLLKHLTKLVLSVGEAHKEGYVQRSGVEGLARLEDEVDQLLTDELGVLKGEARGRNPSGLAKFFTTVRDVFGEGTKSTAADAAKDGAQSAATGLIRDAAIAGTAATAGAALAGGLVGAAAGLALVFAGKGVVKHYRHTFYGHIDSYRELHSLLSTDQFQFLQAGRVEDRVARLLGRKLVP
jgi:hypothetical protein